MKRLKTLLLLLLVSYLPLLHADPPERTAVSGAVSGQGDGITDPEAFRDAIDAPAKSDLGWVDVTDHGADGSDLVDDTDEIQAAIEAAEAARQGVYFPDGDYRIGAAGLVITQSGTSLRGANAETTRITQTTNAGHGISVELGGESTVWGPQTRRITIENLNLYSTGAANSTGRGVNIDGTATLVGQSVSLRKVTLRGWGTGYYNRRCDQSTLMDCVVAYNATGIDYDTSAHSLQLYNTGIARQTVVGVLAKAGAGNVIIGGDYGNQPLDLHVYGPQTLTLIGSNHESNLGGTETIRLENLARMVVVGPYFLKGSGLDVPRFRLVSASALNLQGYSDSGDYTSSAVISADANPNVVGISGTSTIGAPIKAEADNGEKFAINPWPTILKTSGQFTTASAATANQMYTARAFTLGGASDLIWHSPGDLVVHTLSNRAAKGANTDLTTVTGLNLGSVSNPPIRSTSGGSTTGVYFSTNTVGLASSSTATFVAAAGAASIPVASVSMAGLPVYTDNAAAVSGGLAAGRIYRTATGELRIVIP